MCTDRLGPGYFMINIIKSHIIINPQRKCVEVLSLCQSVSSFSSATGQWAANNLFQQLQNYDSNVLKTTAFERYGVKTYRCLPALRHSGSHKVTWRKSIQSSIDAIGTDTFSPYQVTSDHMVWPSQSINGCCTKGQHFNTFHTFTRGMQSIFWLAKRAVRHFRMFCAYLESRRTLWCAVPQFQSQYIYIVTSLAKLREQWEKVGTQTVLWSFMLLLRS